jgi:small-conductance mechanosensitive channel
MQQLIQIAIDMRQMAIDAVPRLLVAVAVIVVLLVVAKIVERIMRAVLVRVRFDALLGQAGLDKTLQRMGVGQSLSVVLPRLTYFLLLFLFARAAADAYGLTAISDAIAAMFAYLPNVIAAVLIVVVGSSASQFAGRMTTQAADESGIEFAKQLGSLVSALILFIVGVMAISQLQFDTEMVRIVTICTLSGLALAFGLSIGLGTRDVTRNVLAGFYARKVFNPGDPLNVRGERGTLRAITATQTIIEQDTGVVVLANTVFLDEVVKH